MYNSKNVVHQYTISYYREKALEKVREVFPDADSSCFSDRYEITVCNGENNFVDNYAEWTYPVEWYPHSLNIMEDDIIDLLVRDGLKTLVNCVFYNGVWCYSLPQQAPDSHDRLIFSRMVKRSMSEFYEWGIDADGFPYERYAKTSYKTCPDKNYLKKLPLQNFVQQLNMLCNRFKGSEFWPDLKKNREKFVSMARDAYEREQAQTDFLA